MLVGAPFDDGNALNAGRTYLFDATTGSLSFTFNKSAPASNDEYGLAVAASSNYFLVAAPFDDTAASNAAAESSRSRRSCHLDSAGEGSLGPGGSGRTGRKGSQDAIRYFRASRPW